MLDEMLLGVIVLNTAIAVTCFWGAWRLVHLRKTVQQWSDSLKVLEPELQQILAHVPLVIQHNRQQLRDRRQQYNQLQFQMARYFRWLRQSLALVQWGTAQWQGSGNLSRRTSEKN